jgi:hypothetical protein
VIAVAVPLILAVTLLWIRSRIRGPRHLTQLERRRFDAWCDEHEVRL